VIARSECGSEKFEAERVLSEQKRNAEAEIFLSDARFEWAKAIDEQSLEDMVAELLRVEGKRHAEAVLRRVRER
jgi:hypothetical protein